MSQGLESRRERSLAVLESRSAPEIETLRDEPPITGRCRRSVEEIAWRAASLLAVSQHDGRPEAELLSPWSNQVDVTEHLTANERAFVQNENGAAGSIDFSWRCYGYYVLLWSLGFIEQLGRPDSSPEHEEAEELLDQFDRESFLAAAKLRSDDELLDAADLMACYALTMDAADEMGEVVDEADDGVVLEYRIALSWLIDPDARDWDTIVAEYL